MQHVRRSRSPKIWSFLTIAFFVIPTSAKAQTLAQPKSNHDSAISRISDTTEKEVIRERYDSGRPKIVREVTLDSNGNYVNHGSWKMFTLQGQIVAQGQFDNNKRTGQWYRIYQTKSAELFSELPYTTFAAPFVSRATFEAGKLNGTWTIYDSKKRKISQWDYRQGARHGLATWYYPNGRKMQEIPYENGLIHGTLLQWNLDGKPTRKEEFQKGRRVATKVQFFKDKKLSKKSEGVFLHAQIIIKEQANWWDAKPAILGRTGRDERHGRWISWFKNGQKQVEGIYKHGIQNGQFTWWYSNGQKALEGNYQAGKQSGAWIWWHRNGQKSAHGFYEGGTPTGRWSQWKNNGKLVQAAEFSNAGKQVIAEKPKKLPRPSILQK